MPAMMRRGFTLIELLIGLIIMGIIGTVLIRTMTNIQRVTGSQASRMESQESMRSATFYLSSVLRELDSYEGDLETATATTLRYRAPRWTALSCSGVTTSGSNLRVTVKRSQLWGTRMPSPTLDSLFVFNEVTTTTRNDDAWLLGTMIDSTDQNCPDGAAGLRLEILISATSGGNAAATAGFLQGSPIRGFQMEELALYTDGSGVNWLGQSTADLTGTWTAVTPLAGPLQPGGLSFTYFDTLNVVTGDKTKVASVGIVVRSQSVTSARGSTGGITNLRDSLITRVALRNNRRF
jgi:prepilin-type N-terminal cleavage/methylation domain-containing protein